MRSLFGLCGLLGSATPISASLPAPVQCRIVLPMASLDQGGAGHPQMQGSVGCITTLPEPPIGDLLAIPSHSHHGSFLHLPNKSMQQLGPKQPKESRREAGFLHLNQCKSSEDQARCDNIITSAPNFWNAALLVSLTNLDAICSRDSSALIPRCAFLRGLFDIFSSSWEKMTVLSCFCV